MCACFDIEYILSDMTYCFYGSSDTSQDRIAEGYKLCGIFELLKVFVSQVQDRPNETYYMSMRKAGGSRRPGSTRVDWTVAWDRDITQPTTPY